MKVTLHYMKKRRKSNSETFNSNNLELGIFEGTILHII